LAIGKIQQGSGCQGVQGYGSGGAMNAGLPNTGHSKISTDLLPNKVMSQFFIEKSYISFGFTGNWP